MKVGENSQTLTPGRYTVRIQSVALRNGKQAMQAVFSTTVEGGPCHGTPHSIWQSLARQSLWRLDLICKAVGLSDGDEFNEHDEDDLNSTFGGKVLEVELYENTYVDGQGERKTSLREKGFYPAKRTTAPTPSASESSSSDDDIPF